MIGLARDRVIDVGPGQDAAANEVHNQKEQLGQLVRACIPHAKHFGIVLEVHGRVGNLRDKDADHGINSVDVLDVGHEEAEEGEEVVDHDELVNCLFQVHAHCVVDEVGDRDDEALALDCIVDHAALRKAILSIMIRSIQK